MDGIFAQKKKNIWLIVLLLCGVFFIGLNCFLNILDSKAPGGMHTFFIFGALLCLFAIPSLLLNHGAFIHIDDTTVKAKYHWFGRLTCRIEDIEFVYSQVNMITLLLKNGKRHTIMGVENSQDLSNCIRKFGYKSETEPKQEIRNKLAIAQAKHKKELFKLLTGCALLFVNIFITVLLTGGRDLGDFGKTDWTIFAVMGAVELITIIGLLIFADRYGKSLLPIEHLKYRLRGAVLYSEPLPYNNTVAVYTDGNHLGRIVVCGFPNDESVYYCVQEIIGNYVLETVHTSKIYDCIDALPTDSFSNLIDITPYL